jgi:hypothetical protein
MLSSLDYFGTAAIARQTLEFVPELSTQIGN